MKSFDNAQHAYNNNSLGKDTPILVGNPGGKSMTNRVEI